MKKIINFYRDSLKNEKIDVVFKEIQTDILNDFEEIVLATGSQALIPHIEGLDKFHWAEILKDKNLPKDKKILIIGGGLIGTEVAHKLLHANNEVILVEMLEEIARGMEMIERKLTLKSFKEKNIKILVNTKVQKIEGNKVYLHKEKTVEVIEHVDLIVVATGMKSYNPLKEKLNQKTNIHLIGDAHKAGKAQKAIKEGYETAKMI